MGVYTLILYGSIYFHFWQLPDRNRPLDPADAGRPYLYAFYAGSNGAGNAVIIDKGTTEI